ncbi:DUF3053 family protein [Bordetella genomosp. 4]|uniref:DUF3053 domain-containing protein n=1 Tax=Bordetella genomosp. 4 TaxID=463044 RepID=A0A261U3P5_9BORD|nr:DUF3053 family protein [Bordetella genomosp. 4]OZI48563.1 hypothetical protein CAL21_12000 [Bordetella genomosp. 4]OZI56586.1 hypothetical protein CAL20_14315 [Bordetella genomosp. 4]
MRIAFQFISIVLLSMAIAGCVNKEPEQRAAFIAWLQTQVIDTADRRVPALDETQRDALGDYADQYAVLSAVDNAVQQQMQNLTNAFEHEELASLAQLQARHQTLLADRQALAAGQEALRQAQAHAQSERAEWEQPADLQPVYTKAYDKIATQPVGVLDELTAIALASLDDALRVADFLTKHADQITIEADSAAVRDPSVQRELNQLLDTLNSHAAAVEQAQARLQTLQPL